MDLYFKLEPEVAGRWGPGTEADTTVHPPIVRKLEYTFEGWLGDELLESFPCFIVSDKLAKSVVAENFTGFVLASVKVSSSPEFRELHSSTILPSFQWLRVSGAAGESDFGLTPDAQLVVSGRALEVINQHAVSHCEVSPWQR